MSGRHHIDKTKSRAKDKDARAKVAERVNITAKEQGECRREGAIAMYRFVDAFTGDDEDACPLLRAMEDEINRRWPRVAD